MGIESEVERYAEDAFEKRRESVHGSAGRSFVAAGDFQKRLSHSARSGADNVAIKKMTGRWKKNSARTFEFLISFANFTSK